MPLEEIETRLDDIDQFFSWRLCERYKTVLLARLLYGFDWEEIAVLMNSKPEYVKHVYDDAVQECQRIGWCREMCYGGRVLARHYVTHNGRRYRKRRKPSDVPLE